MSIGSLSRPTVRNAVAFRVYGVPAPQGSMRVFMIKPKGGGAQRPIITHARGKLLAEWRAAIVQAAIKARVPVVQGPVFLKLLVILPAPVSRPTVLKTQKQMDYWLRPWRQPDADKLGRGVIDAMTGVVLKDDAQIVRLLIEKVYANEGERPGVDITIEAV